ncbi:alpha-amylase family glycosyl hydrolase [Maridesulfovibrio sp.]|uniref:alpha-amylase family glycosyl hydrolase n=1 Tax=Maridesulfovibrio sp. TaxID=2795000 RepID=UPI002A18C8A7|nr:alpha-amylase family glycosyl hydrolase [Maridesulfovibrio sp.]
MDKSYFGARFHRNGECSFKIFAPHIQHASISLKNSAGISRDMDPVGLGFHEITLSGIMPGTMYSFTLDGENGIPDPASLWQPKGLRDSSVVIDHHCFDWMGDNFAGLPMGEMIIYEVHVGTFSPEHSFQGVIGRLDYLRDLGVNTLQLLPVAGFAGNMAWGYATEFPYSPHSPYGSPDEFKKLVRECHLREMAVLIDVPCASLMPVKELSVFNPLLFSDRYCLRHGKAVNFDGRFSGGVREMVIQCALSWLRDYRVDGLRISDAHLIFDQSPVHFLEELSVRVSKFSRAGGRHCVVITGDKRNAARPVLPHDKGGYNLDALYNDNFCNALQCRLTGSSDGLLEDYADPRRMVSALQYGFAYRGELSPHFMRLQGQHHSELNGSKFVVYSQGHDRDSGPADKCRIIEKAGFEAAKLAAGATILSPYVPMIFMGEEYGEPAPFLYFNDTCSGLPSEGGEEAVSDAGSSFSACRLDWQNMETERGKAMLSLYHSLLKVRREHPTIHEPCRSRSQVQEINPGLVLVLRNSVTGSRRYAAVLLNFNHDETSCRPAGFLPEGIWNTEIYSASPAYGGTADPLPVLLPAEESIMMAPQSFALFLCTPVDSGRP